MKKHLFVSADFKTQNLDEILLIELAKQEVEFRLLWPRSKRLILLNLFLTVKGNPRIDMLYKPIPSLGGGMAISLGDFAVQDDSFEVKFEVIALDDLDIVALLFNTESKKILVRQPQLQPKTLKANDKPWVGTLKY